MNKSYLTIASNSNTLHGMVHRPEHVQEYPPLIVIHGYFSANRNGPQRLFVKMADKLSKIGYCVYRFDLSGMGENDGDLSTIHFKDHVIDVANIIRYVHNKHKGRKINIVAHSLGCNLVLRQIAKSQSVFDHIIMLAPFLTNDTTLLQVFGETKAKELISNGFTYRKGIYSDLSFFTNSDAESFVQSCNSIDIQMDSILAQEDQFVPHELTIKTFEQIHNVHTYSMPKADHNFLEIQPDVIELITRLLSSKPS